MGEKSGLQHIIYISLAILFILAGCKDRRNMEMKIDDWYVYPVNAGVYTKMDINYYMVKDTEEFTTINEKLVNDQFFVVQNGPTRKVYVRALSYTNNEDGYTISRFENSLWVNHSALTNQTTMKRHILAFEYADEIKALYTTCYAAK